MSETNAEAFSRVAGEIADLNAAREDDVLERKTAPTAGETTEEKRSREERDERNGL